MSTRISDRETQTLDAEHGSNGSAPDQECDLVMKGGITSGVVYPSLVLELKDRYRFRYIGGTSAGAIAAALTAAAEYRRQNGGGNAGFVELEGVQRYVSENLSKLFQPTRDTQPLLQLALALMSEKAGKETAGKKAGTGQQARHSLGRALTRKAAQALLVPLAMGLVGGIVGWLFCVWGLGVGPMVSGVLAVLWIAGGVLGGLAYVAYRGKPLLQACRAAQDGGFGLCPGSTDLPGEAHDSALSVWLGRKLNACAGFPEKPDENAPEAWFPLTFGHLWGDPDGIKKAREHDIKLQLISSNLSQGLAYLLPFEHDELFIFREDDFRSYFEEATVNFLIRQAGSGNPPLPEGYHYLPPPHRLPVIVAVRMSLSFPLLFTAVRLWTIPASATGPEGIAETDLQDNWFSDGGVCSNFPIHFFDSWLPRRPTFGVNLTTYPPKVFNSVFEKDGEANLRQQSRVRKRGSGSPSVRMAPVCLPRPTEQLDPQWLEIKGLRSFLQAILNTAKDCHDNAQAVLPSYRERIVQIRFKDDEGGLNLTMNKRTINDLERNGTRAGKLLLEFAQTSTGRMRQHQWIRFRVLMKQLEEALRQLQQVLDEKDRLEYVKGRLDAVRADPSQLKDLLADNSQVDKLLKVLADKDQLEEVLNEMIEKAFDFRGLLKQQLVDKAFPSRIEVDSCDELGQRIVALGKCIQTWNVNPNFSTDAPVPDPMLRVVPRV